MRDVNTLMLTTSKATSITKGGKQRLTANVFPHTNSIKLFSQNCKTCALDSRMIHLLIFLQAYPPLCHVYCFICNYFLLPTTVTIPNIIINEKNKSQRGCDLPWVAPPRILMPSLKSWPPQQPLENVLCLWLPLY